MKNIKSASFILVLFLLFASCTSSQVKDNSIHLISREDGSGTRGAFTSLTGISRKDATGESFDYTSLEAAITNSTSVVMLSVSGDTQAIGYLSLGSMNDTIKALTIEGVPPTVETITNERYPIARPFLLATLKPQDPLITDFTRFILSSEGQEVVRQQQYVPVAQGDPFESLYPTGKLVIGGSSSVTPVIEKLKEAYVKINPQGIIEIQQSDSTTGLASVASGVYDVGMTSRALKDSEKLAGMEVTTLALDGIVVVVHPENPVKNLTLQQVSDIFTGEITQWSQVEGGKA